MLKRLLQFIMLLVASWTVMTLTHEVGHLIGGKLGGAALREFDLAPWRLPYSLHSPDPHPQLTLWAGPLLGVILPLTVAAVVRHWTVWFIADFCLLANGVYLALAWWMGDRFLDTPRMLDANVHPVWIATYCVLTIGIGYAWFRRDCKNMFADVEVN
ncbi:hypothetical protein Q31b_56130 [Novipirellula aureliae]|uniref:Peptidase family M50 n=1 Tax=Novipirellula aureliae TaxID=2527966 RepID=A0A5C6DBB0_9BACT|nr:hypothetical protein [Novipirellula aureliae]TWU34142.1 hypothetical protein Q31b_56130 [Novipirellula aureliae]